MAETSVEKETWEWEHFERLENFRAKCNVCPTSAPTILIYRRMDRIARHFKREHPLIKYLINKIPYWMYQYCIKNDSKIKCTCCDYETASEELILRHLIGNHNISSYESRSNVVWDLFYEGLISRHDDDNVLCEKCNTLYTAVFKNDLNKHIHDKHPEIWKKHEKPPSSTDMEERPKEIDMPSPATGPSPSTQH